MGTKNNPGHYDCHEKADPDEPVFVLLASDPLAPILVRLWADLRSRIANNPPKVTEARKCAEEMEKWNSRRLHQ